jgi:hypothetical protein
LSNFFFFYTGTFLKDLEHNKSSRIHTNNANFRVTERAKGVPKDRGTQGRAQAGPTRERRCFPFHGFHSIVEGCLQVGDYDVGHPFTGILALEMSQWNGIEPLPELEPLFEPA